MFTFLFAALLLHASGRPQVPDLVFTVVRDAKGRALKGPYAENTAMREILSTRTTEAWTVEMAFTMRDDHPYSEAERGQEKHWPLAGTPISGDRKGREQFTVLDRWCTDQYVVITQGSERMRIDLPDAGPARTALHEHAMGRSGFDASPEVIRFRPGQFSYAELAHEAGFEKLEARLAEGIKNAAAEEHRKNLAEGAQFYRDQPPPALPTAPYIPPPPPPMTEPDGAGFWKEQPPLLEVRILHLYADRVQLSITGRIMLTGACASSMPLFGMEMFTDSAWVERVPLELTQLDCGMSWGDWEERSLVLPLRSRTAAHAPAGRKELVPGTYRFVFMGGDMQRVATEAFRIE